MLVEIHTAILDRKSYDKTHWPQLAEKVAGMRRCTVNHLESTALETRNAVPEVLGSSINLPMFLKVKRSAVLLLLPE